MVDESPSRDDKHRSRGKEKSRDKDKSHKSGKDRSEKHRIEKSKRREDKEHRKRDRDERDDREHRHRSDGHRRSHKSRDRDASPRAAAAPDEVAAKAPVVENGQRAGQDADDSRGQPVATSRRASRSPERPHSARDVAPERSAASKAEGARVGGAAATAGADAGDAATQGRGERRGREAGTARDGEVAREPSDGRAAAERDRKRAHSSDRDADRKRARSSDRDADDKAAKRSGSSRDAKKPRVDEREGRDRGDARSKRDKEQDAPRARSADRDRRERESRDDSERQRAREKAKERDRERDRPRERERDDKRPRSSERDRDRGREKERGKAKEPALSKEEQEVLERRRKVEAWQAKKRAMEEQEAASSRAKAEQDAAADAKGWTLEDDGSDEDEQPNQNAATNEDEDDPLDAFMSDITVAVKRDIETLPPEIAKEALKVNENLAKVGVQLAVDDAVGNEPAGAPSTDAVVKTEDDAPSAAPTDAVEQPGTVKTEDGKDGKEGKAVKHAQLRVRFQKAKAKRKKALERSVGDVLNPYGSDSSGESESDRGEEGEEEEKEDKEMDDEEWAKAVNSGKLSKGERLVPVDHSTIEYKPFRKCFYIQSAELARMSEGELAALYKELDGIKVRGKGAPAPVRSWAQCGLSSGVLAALKKNGCPTPLPIQAQSLPIIMSGRDCISIAKTGSGKTLGFVLPLLRHIIDQEPVLPGDGPIGLIMAPTRELVQQISKEVKTYGKPLNVGCCPVFGGSGIKDQITELKRGVEVVACTPGRMIDLLVSGNGSITNLRRVTMLIIDEADRMFDMGFEPQITRIVQNIRPDRQTVMFSATFPRQVETLARALLQSPIEVQVGGRSVVNADIAQFVELRPEDERFLRLLEILGEYSEMGKVLVFVNTQDRCAKLFQQLMSAGYANLMLHGDMDQMDRETTLQDFKSGVCSVLVATSVAARGLDVKDLVLVVNYDVPNHLEEYVHRAGRTGRAGNKGTAITFISEDEEVYAPDLVKALKDSKAVVPADLQKLADRFNERRKKGLAKAHGSGYGGSGFNFDVEEDSAHLAQRKTLALEYRQPGDDDEGGGGGGGEPQTAASAAAEKLALKQLEQDNDDDIRIATARPATTHVQFDDMPPPPPDMTEEKRREAQRIAAAAAARLASTLHAKNTAARATQFDANSAANMSQSMIAVAQLAASQIAGSMGWQQDAATATARHELMKQAQLRASAVGAVQQMYFESELVVNDFAQSARYHVTHRDTLAKINELTGAAVTVRGRYYAPGTPIPEDDRKLYLLIEGPTEQHVKHAKAELKRLIEERTEKVMRRDAPVMGRFKVA